jgi:hypothetical protein
LLPVNHVHILVITLLGHIPLHRLQSLVEDHISEVMVAPRGQSIEVIPELLTLEFLPIKRSLKVRDTATI